MDPIMMHAVIKADIWVRPPVLPFKRDPIQSASARSMYKMKRVLTGD